MTYESLLRRCSSLVKSQGSLHTDRELLRQYAFEGNQDAFASLVLRHASLVYKTCRRSLPTTHDAEDACQATFLILARKAAECWQESVADWLYVTARRVAGDAIRTSTRRKRREHLAAVPDSVSMIDQLTARELLSVVDEELERLPRIYREPLVLYHLENLTREQIAVRFGVSIGTVKTRLERGRKRLYSALTKRGVVPGMAMLTAAATSPALASLSQFVDSILSSVLGKPSDAVTTLANNVAANGTVTKGWVGAATVAVLAAAIAFGTPVTGTHLTAGASPVEAATNDEKPTASKLTPAESLLKLEKKFDTEVANVFWDSVYNKRTAEAIHKKMADLTKLYAREAIVIAKESPQDATGFEAAFFIANKIGLYGRGQEFEESLKLIGEHHLNNLRIRDLFPRVAYCETPGMTFAIRVAEKATNNELRGIALFTIGCRVKGELYHEDDEAKRSEGIARATGHFQKAAKEGPQAVVWFDGADTTIEKAVASNLKVLSAMKSAAVGKPAPEIIGMGLGGKKINFTSYAGKVVLVDIWVTWCGPCREMIPQEREMVKRLKDKPFALLSVSCDTEKEKLVAFLEKEPMPWDHCFDGVNGPVVEVLHTRAYPTLFLIDHTGVIRNKWVGAPDEKELNQAIDDLVEKAAKAKG